jgi:HK97 gp10 family phage protein
MGIDADTKASIDAFKAEMKRRSELIQDNLGRAVVNSCQLVENTAKKGMTNTQIDGSKSYKVGKNRYHGPSVEFDYPAVDTGALRRSVTHDVSAHGLGGENYLQGRIGSQLKYASYLETGTSRMSPRPWLKPSIANNREKIHSILSKAVSSTMAGRTIDIGDVETSE